MTRADAIKCGHMRITTIIAATQRLCGCCNTPRKECEAQLNEGCVVQWLDGEVGSKFRCDYAKAGSHGYDEKIKQFYLDWTKEKGAPHEDQKNSGHC